MFPLLKNYHFWGPGPIQQASCLGLPVSKLVEPQEAKPTPYAAAVSMWKDQGLLPRWKGQDSSFRGGQTEWALFPGTCPLLVLLLPVWLVRCVCLDVSEPFSGRAEGHMLASSSLGCEPRKGREGVGNLRCAMDQRV